MSSRFQPDATRAALWVAIALWIALSVNFIPLAGLQNDEALFATPLYPTENQDVPGPIWQRRVPVMVMSYLGALKAFLYAPVLTLFGASVWTIRLPVVAFGAITIFIFYRIALVSGGRWVAGAAVLWLATDPVFLLTNTFDWGPVAVDHLLLVTAVWLLYRFGSQNYAGSQNYGESPEGNPAAGSPRYLAGAFACFGLALWNKAIFSWELIGLSSGVLLVFGPEIWRLATRRNLSIAAAAFLVGALPLAIYNIRSGLETFSANTQLEPEAISSKWVQFEAAAQGRSLFGYLVVEEWEAGQRAGHTVIGRASGWLRDRVGEHRETGFYYFLLVLLAAVPLWWKSRAARFSIVFVGVTWLMMALTVGAGGSAHHVILVWPFPLLFAAVTLGISFQWIETKGHRGAAKLAKGVATCVCGWFLLMNLLVLNQYRTQFERSGAADSFTDAVFPLSKRVAERAARSPGGRPPIYVIDWGMFDSLNLFHRGQLNLRIASATLSPPEPSPADRELVVTWLQDRGALWVAHVPEREVFPGVGAHLDRIAGEAGFERMDVERIADSNGRPVFEVFRVQPAIAH